MQIIDNINVLLGDELKKDLKRGQRLRIAASSFSIFAFEALRKELQQIDELQFLFTEQTFTAERATDGKTLYSCQTMSMAAFCSNAPSRG